MVLEVVHGDSQVVGHRLVQLIKTKKWARCVSCVMSYIKELLSEITNIDVNEKAFK